MTDYWMDNAFEAGKHTLVDVGPVNDKAARNKADKLFKHVSRKENLMLVGMGPEIVVRIPPAKVKKVLAAFPGIKGKCTYSWCTHSWR